jgi:ubiquinone/menaquinone biosynthesis C-methylase UbiE
VISYDTLATRYASARAFLPATADLWTEFLKPFLPQEKTATVLDLGCGSGRFSSLIVDRFKAQVIGCDPSFPMLKAAGNGAFYCAGRAEELPLSGASIDLAWLSQVIHHVKDREACARELRRIIRPDGIVLIRGAFGDRLESYPVYFRFFPSARRITAELPTIHNVLSAFRANGFSLDAFHTVPQKTCDSLAELAERTKKRVDTPLVLMPDEEFARCQAELEREASKKTTPIPSIEMIDVMVLKPRPQV